MTALSRVLRTLTIVALSTAPISDAAVSLLLATALYTGLAIALGRAFFTRSGDPGAIETAAPAPVYLARRTVPHLRARHPVGVVEAQVRWRQAAEARRIGRLRY